MYADPHTHTNRPPPFPIHVNDHTQECCFDFFFQIFLMSLKSVSLKCVLVYLHVCVGGLFGISVMDISLVLAVTLEPQSRVCVCVFKPLCMGFWVRERLVEFVPGQAVHAGLKLF